MKFVVDKRLKIQRTVLKASNKKFGHCPSETNASHR